MADLRSLPSVDTIINSNHGQRLCEEFGHDLLVGAIRESLNEIRVDFQKMQTIPGHEKILIRIEKLLEKWTNETLFPVLNATGTILHTNLGRAPLSHEAIEAVRNVSQSYNTLEFNLKSGKRGSRLLHAEQLLTRLTGAEAALVVNNNASAVLLALTALAKRKRVVISRTQLVEIGGGFRIPDVMKQSGAKLIEIGTTNRVHLRDYEDALLLHDPVGLVLRAHHSNYKIIGFTTEPSLKEIVDAAHSRDVKLMDDLGSGTFLKTEDFGLSHEPTILESVQAGADLICFSGDKLLGGPQAGILIGKKELIAKIKKYPLARAVRSDKMCLAALSATLIHYLKGEALQKIPIWRMISADLNDIRSRAEKWQKELGVGILIESKSKIGGGSLPEETLPTWVFVLRVEKPDRFLKQLRDLDTPIIARIINEQVAFDPRTILLEQENKFLVEMKKILAGAQKK